MNAQKKAEGGVRKKDNIRQDYQQAGETSEKKGTAGKYSVPAAGGMAPGETGVTVPSGDNEEEKAGKEEAGEGVAGEGVAGEEKANERTNNEETTGKEA